MRRVKACFMAAVLCLSLLLSPALAAEEVYFTGVNDQLLRLTDETMPMWVNGTLYVPASVFDENVTGVDLGFNCSQSLNSDIVTLYNLRQMLVFDLSAGNSRNQHTGEVFSDRAITRNGVVYLPVAAVCSFFGLTYVYRYTDYGYLVRIRSSAAYLSDASFIDAASTAMNRYLQAYLQSQTPEEPEVPDEQPGEEQPVMNVRVCLAFLCQSGQAAQDILDRLDQGGDRGLFLFPVQEMAGQDDLIRRIVGSGHCVGLIAQGQTAQESAQLLEQGNQALSHIARVGTVTALVPEEQREELEQAGWVCWNETLSGLAREGESAYSSASRILRTIGTRQRTVYLTMDDTSSSAQVLDRLLDQMDSGQYTILTPLETRL